LGWKKIAEDLEAKKKGKERNSKEELSMLGTEQGYGKKSGGVVRAVTIQSVHWRGGGSEVNGDRWTQKSKVGAKGLNKIALTPT